MPKPDYQPYRGQLEAREHFALDYRSGEYHLDRVSVVVRLRVSHDQAVKLQRKYPGTRPNFMVDTYGEFADLEITLRADNATLDPYLAWRDSILAEMYEAIT